MKAEPLTISLEEMMEAGVHFGHQARRWNPKMEPFIYGQRNGIHIIDIEEIWFEWKDVLPYKIFMDNYLGPDSKTVVKNYSRLIDI